MTIIEWENWDDSVQQWISAIDPYKVIARETNESVLAQWWCLLNKWEWPQQLGTPEPQQHTPGGKRSQLLDVIMSRIGHKACNREWNRDAMTDAQHEEWWAKQLMDDDLIQRKPAKFSYWKRVREAWKRLRGKTG